MNRALFPSLLVALLLAATPFVVVPHVLAQDEKGDGGKEEPAKKDEEKKDEEPKKDETPKEERPAEKKGNDLSELEAKTLASKLHVPPKWNSEAGTVDLLYSFFEDDETKDWKITGADRVERAEGKAAMGPGRFGGGGRRRGGGAGGGGEPAGLRITVGSGTATVMLDPIELKGDFTLEVFLMLSQAGPSADLVYLVGVKGKEGFGARFGDQLVKLGPKGITALTKNKPSFARFGPKDSTLVKLERKGDELKTSFDGAEGQTRKYAPGELDGKVGLLLSNNARITIARFRIQGTIDRSKL